MQILGGDASCHLLEGLAGRRDRMVKPTDGPWPPMTAEQVARFLAWLDFQVDRHYAQRAAVKAGGGSPDLAYSLRLEAHTYERVRTALLDVLAGQAPARVPSR